MKYKVGDKVKIRESLAAFRDVVAGMLKFKGSVVTIAKIDEGGDSFRILEDQGYLRWTLVMVEGLANEEKAERGETNMRLLELWKTNQVVEIERSFSKERTSEIDKDPLVTKVNNINKQIAELVNEVKTNYGKTISIELKYVKEQFLSIMTADKIEELREKRDEEFNALHKLYSEISARLELCESEASKIEVLQKYKVLDSEGKLSNEKQINNMADAKKEGK